MCVLNLDWRTTWFPELGADRAHGLLDMLPICEEGHHLLVRALPIMHVVQVKNGLKFKFWNWLYHHDMIQPGKESLKTTFLQNLEVLD